MKRFLMLCLGMNIAMHVMAEDFPSEQERLEISQRLSARRNAIEAEYKQALKACYQQFDVNNCRIEARERRIQADKALRPEELSFNAMERRLHAVEQRQQLDEKNSEAKQKEAEAQRAQTLLERKQRTQEAEQKQLDHQLKGTHRGDYDERVREAQEHRASVEKRLRERNKTPADPLPVPGASR